MDSVPKEVYENLLKKYLKLKKINRNNEHRIAELMNRFQNSYSHITSNYYSTHNDNYLLRRIKELEEKLSEIVREKSSNLEYFS